VHSLFIKAQDVMFEQKSDEQVWRSWGKSGVSRDVTDSLSEIPDPTPLLLFTSKQRMS
jgi:hypothetical protein